MSFVIHKDLQGNTVRASLGANFNPLPVVPLSELKYYEPLRYRLTEPLPQLRIPPPEILVAREDGTYDIDTIDLAWRAAYRKNNRGVTCKSKKIAESRYESVYACGKLLDKHNISFWTYFDYAHQQPLHGKSHWMSLWATHGMALRHLDKVLEIKPPQQGWTILMSEASEILKLRTRIWNAVTEVSHVSLDACVEAADRVCAALEFERKIQDLHVVRDNYLRDHFLRIQRGLWPWPS